MDNLEIEVLVIEGKKQPYCSRILLYFHFFFVLIIAAVCSYYISGLTRLHYQRGRVAQAADRQHSVADGLADRDYGERVRQADPEDRLLP